MKFTHPIAIVGIGGIFPKAKKLREFWINIVEGVNASQEPPQGRWVLPVEEAYSPGGPKPDKVYSSRACFVDDFDIKDALPLDKYGLDESYIEKLDVSCHLTLYAGINAFNDCVTEGLNRKKVGVILGNIALPTEKASAFSWEILGRTFEEKVLKVKSPLKVDNVNPINRYVSGLPAGILAKALGFSGGSYTIDAACASSLYALKMAVDELISGRADAMLTGGISRPDSLYTQMGFSQLKALSPNGICSPFDINGNGLVVGEGAGIIVLKRLNDALKAGDHIYGVIKGIGLSNDRAGNLLAPDTEGQVRCMKAAYKQAGWLPQDVDIVECHATGTPVGDAVEFESLKRLWKDMNWEKGQCVIGAVKSNIGHLLTGAGAASLIKVLLALKEKTLPPNANFKSPNPKLSMGDSPFKILKKPQKWHRRGKNVPRRAAVSAFGFGGINAHVLIEEWIPHQYKINIQSSSQPINLSSPSIAVVGMDAKIGPWNSLNSFRDRVLDIKDSYLPKSSGNWFGVEDSQWFKKKWPEGNPFKGFGIERLSIPFGKFRIPPKEMEEMLPQQLLMMQVAAGALEDSGYTAKDHINSGVFIGASMDLNTTNFSLRWALREKAKEWARKLCLNLSDKDFEEWLYSLKEAIGPALNANRTMGALGSVIASRIAREFKFGGPSFTISSEETSSLKALEIAVRRLQNRDIRLAIVGGVDFASDIRALIGSFKSRRSRVLQMLSENSDPSYKSGGTIFGDGAVAVVLKRLDEAKRDGDKIYAVIKGIGNSLGGKVDSFMPNSYNYKKAMDRAYFEARCFRESIGYIEIHRSGHPEEDKMEIEAISRFYDTDKRKFPCAVGCVKDSIGYLGAASGLASFVKQCLSLYHKILPSFKNLRNIKSGLIKKSKIFYLPAYRQYWIRNKSQGPRRAALSSFSIDGNCTHIVMEDYEDEEKTLDIFKKPKSLVEDVIFVSEGDTISSIADGLQKLKKMAEDFQGSNIFELAKNWFETKPLDKDLQRAVSIVCRDKEELLKRIELSLKCLLNKPDKPFNLNGLSMFPDNDANSIFYSPNPLNYAGKIAFVFPGSGNHYPGMGRRFCGTWPEILQKQDLENNYLRNQFKPEYFWNKDLLVDLNKNHTNLMIGHVALCTVVSDLLRSFNVVPRSVIGYSLGESAALFAMRAWKDRDMMLERLEESSLFKDDLGGACNAARVTWGLREGATIQWTLGIVNVSAKKVLKALRGKKRVYLLISNSSEESVVGGDRGEVLNFVKEMGCIFFPLEGVTTVHCEVVNAVKKAYRDFHLFNVTPPEKISFYSTGWGRKYEIKKDRVADAILSQAINYIDFNRVIKNAYEDGVRIFIETGPGASCTRVIRKILTGKTYFAQSASHTGENEVSSFLRLLAHLIVERVPVNLDFLYNSRYMEKIKDKEISKEMCLNILMGGKPFKVESFQKGKEISYDENFVSYKKEVTPEEYDEYSSTEVNLTSNYNDYSVRKYSLPEKKIDMTKESSYFGRRLSFKDSVLNRMKYSPSSPAREAMENLMKRFVSTQKSKSEAHEVYLSLSRKITESLSRNISHQLNLLMALDKNEPLLFENNKEVKLEKEVKVESLKLNISKKEIPVLDRHKCMEFAIGSVEKVLGKEFAQADTYPTRVRLPDEPLMLVDRIMKIEGVPKSLTKGRVITEHDVLPGDWYLDNGRIPTCIAVESGQADLFLSGYLGIDFKTKGLAVYRLLDAVVTFYDSLPKVGKVLRYDIKIERFFQQGGTYLFKFNFDCTVDGKMLMTMRDGCAGFFSKAQLEAGKGIVHTTLDKKKMLGKKPKNWKTPAPMKVESLKDKNIQALRDKDLVRSFGGDFEGLPLKNPLTIPGGRMKLVDRVLHIDPKGGRFGLGIIKSEADINPDDWFLICHFCDDNVMPGTLMYECCLHTLRIFLLRMGWIGEEKETVWEPVPGVDSSLKCRGQVIETTKKVAYEISIKEIGYNPEPYAIADALMYADGKAIVEMKNMSLKLLGYSKEKIDEIWKNKKDMLKSLSLKGQDQNKTLYDYDKILAFAIGNPSEAFGKPYEVFDKKRTIARLPGPPYDFMSRVVDICAKPWEMKAGGNIESQYDIPKEAWYFNENRSNYMPYAVLLEIALQPCGWFAAYMGSALTSDIDLKFRNLGGSGIQYKPVDRNTGVLSVKVKVTKVSVSGGMIIQNYEFEVLKGNELVYKGDTYFGFFSREALANQVGIRDVEIYKTSKDELMKGYPLQFPVSKPFPYKKFNLVDSIEEFSIDGGPQKMGYIKGVTIVNPATWFFKAHFYQDPVCPGSLGIESFLHLLRYFAYEKWGKDIALFPHTPVLDTKHSWTYRGQIIPNNKKVTVDAWITSIDEKNKKLTADGLLSVDGIVIYQLNNFSLRMK